MFRGKRSILSTKLYSYIKSQKILDVCSPKRVVCFGSLNEQNQMQKHCYLNDNYVKKMTIRVGHTFYEKYHQQRRFQRATRQTINSSKRTTYEKTYLFKVLVNKI